MTPESLQRLFEHWANSWATPTASDAVVPADRFATDPRFKDSAWAETPYGRLMTNWYGMATDTAQHVAALGNTLPEHQKDVWGFYVQYAVDALSPSNYFLTNPQALQKNGCCQSMAALTVVSGLDVGKNFLELQSGGFGHARGHKRGLHQ